LIVGSLLAGCGSDRDPPRVSINNGIADEIRANGGDTRAWKFDNDCVLNGSCTATLRLKSSPAVVLATNSYVARDSRAFLKGADHIGDAIERFYRGGPR